MKDWRQRITTNPDQCGGRPCIREMRIRVVDVLDLLVAGLSYDQILEELPDLVKEDIEVSIKYARGKIDHPEVTAVGFVNFLSQKIPVIHSKSPI